MSENVLTKSRHSIARRLIVSVVMFSALLTVVISAIQLFRDYQLDVSSIESRIRQIEEVSLKALTNYLWVVDAREMQTHIDALHNLPDMQYLEIVDGERTWARAGDAVYENVIRRDFPMVYRYRDQDLQLGTLTVVASLEGVYQRLLDKVVIILISNGIKTFFVAGFILVIFQLMVTRHLEKIASFVRSDSMKSLQGYLSLDRKDDKRLKQDELGVVTTALNEMIDDLKISYESLRQREERVRLLLNSTAEAIYGVNMDGICIFVNPACLRMLGYQEDEVMGRNMHQLVHHSRADGTAYPEAECHILLATLAGKDAHRDDEVLWRRDGSSFAVEYWSHPIRHEDKVLGSVVTFFDITERVRAEEELRQHRENLQQLVDERTAELRKQATIIDQTHDSVISTDMQGVVTTWNKGAERLYGYTADQAIGRHIAFLYAEEDHDFLQNEVLDRLLEQGEHEAEVRVRNRAGEDIDVHLSLSLLRDDQGQAVGMIGYSIDISKRKQVEKDLALKAAALETSLKELESFSYSVSHDLRSPLRSIDGFSQVLLEDYSESLDETGQDHLQRIRNAAQRMGRLIDDLLKLSRVTRSIFKKEKVDLSSIAQEIAERLQLHEPERKVEFEIQPGLRCMGDANLLEIMLDNLIGNAWKYTGKEEAARIEFGRTSVDDEPVFYVRDNGAGFNENYKHKMFLSFQRLHDDGEFKGSGIGLAIVSRIISRHNGRIWAESEEGRGASFYFTL